MKTTQFSKTTIIFTLLFVIAAFAALSKQNTIHRQHDNIAKLNAMRVAIDNVNSALLPNHFETEGESVRFINGHPVDLLNGKLRASRTSLRRGLDSAFLAPETNVSALRGWDIIEMQSGNGQRKSVQLVPDINRSNCFLVYSEAGTETQPKHAGLSLITHGC